MKNAKKICAFATVALFLSLILASANSAGNEFGDIFEIEYADDNGNTYNVVIEIEEEQLKEFINSWCSWEDTLKIIRSDGEIDDQELIDLENETITMLEELKELTYDPETGVYYFPNINIPTLVHDHLFMIGGGTRIFSVGRGRVWLPFNRQGETFVGKRFAPIFVRHTIGFTRVKSVSLFPFSWFILDRLFTHRICTFGFTGLYIDFGKRYFDNSIGPVILIGIPRLIRLSDDIL